MRNCCPRVLPNSNDRRGRSSFGQETVDLGFVFLFVFVCSILVFAFMEFSRSRFCVFF